jgi:hypothetical protein
VSKKGSCVTFALRTFRWDLNIVCVYIDNLLKTFQVGTSEMGLILFNL